MDARKSQTFLLRAEKALAAAARDVFAGRGVTPAARAAMTTALAAGAAFAPQGLAAVIAPMARAAQDKIALLSGAPEGVVDLARFMTEAHSRLDAAAAELGYRLLPVAEGQPKEPPVDLVTRILAGLC